MDLIDTSVLLAAVLRERHTSAAQDWLAAATSPATSRWTLVEAMSGLSVKVRHHLLSSAERDTVALHARALVDRALRVVDVTSSDLMVAAAWCERAELRLRGPDALHLAVAHQHRAAF